MSRGTVLQRTLPCLDSSLIFREAWLMLRERPLHRTRSARICAALSRSRTDIRPPLSPPGCFVRGLPLVLPGTLQAALGDDVALVPPGVPRALSSHSMAPSYS